MAQMERSEMKKLRDILKIAEGAMPDAGADLRRLVYKAVPGIKLRRAPSSGNKKCNNAVQRRRTKQNQKRAILEAIARGD